MEDLIGSGGDYGSLSVELKNGSGEHGENGV
jgi:hypothetical protein